MPAPDFTTVDQALQEVAAQQHADLLQLRALRYKYQTLKGALEELPSRTSYAATVPFGKRAFIPGRMVHTNEVMVLIGANYFVERSATQAMGIASRRIDLFDEKIGALQKQMKSTRLKCEVSRTMAGSHDDGAIEIREHVGADGQATGEALQHPINPRRAGIQMADPTMVEDTTQADLDQYHGLDMAELVRILEEEERAMSDDNQDDEGGQDSRAGQDIVSATGAAPQGEASVAPRSPRDIYEIHRKKMTAKKSSGESPVAPPSVTSPPVSASTNVKQRRVASPATAGAFSGEVAERLVPISSVGSSSQSETSTKRISKFKQQRLQARGSNS